jgi:hypothetical protein
MKTALCIVMLFLLSLTGAARAFDGPLQVRNQFPLFLGIAPPFLESAEVRDSVTLGLNHSSTYVIEKRPHWGISMDLEMTELDLRFKKRLGRRSEIGLDVPVIRPSGGFFDRPLQEFHDWLPFGDYGRNERPHNAFLYEITYHGATVVRGVNDRTGLGDLRLTFKRVVSASTATVSVMANVELPTGDAGTGYGSGSYDFTAAVLADRRWGDTYRGFANAGYIFPGDLKGLQTVPLRNAFYAGCGIEAAWWDRFSVLVQTLAQQSPFPRTGTHHVDRPGVLLTVGGRYAFRRGSLELSLTEDPSVSGTPDFIANLAYSMDF